VERYSTGRVRADGSDGSALTKDAGGTAQHPAAIAARGKAKRLLIHCRDEDRDRATAVDLAPRWHMISIRVAWRMQAGRAGDSCACHDKPWVEQRISCACSTHSRTRRTIPFSRGTLAVWATLPAASQARQLPERTGPDERLTCQAPPRSRAPAPLRSRAFRQRRCNNDPRSLRDRLTTGRSPPTFSQ